MAHTTVGRRSQAETVQKGSRFLAVVAEAATVADARALLDELRRAHPDATHHCSAWRIGDVTASDDDGEPGGTAGVPMLGVLLKRELDHVVAICVRWYGGTNLGAGGLVRAYAGTVAKALDAAGTRFVHDMTSCRVRVPFAHVDAVHRLVDGWDGAVKGEPSYDAHGAVLPLRVRSDGRDELARALAEVTAGDATLTDDDPQRA